MSDGSFDGGLLTSHRVSRDLLLDEMYRYITFRIDDLVSAGVAIVVLILLYLKTFRLS